MAKRKICKGCERQRSLDSFPNSATARDGKLGYCSDCWSERMSAARSKRGAGNGTTEKESPEEMSATKSRKKANGSSLELFNKALDAANGSKEVWQVVADDGDQKEFRGKNARRRAYKQALLWTLDGFECVLREIHEYKPSLRLEVVG